MLSVADKLPEFARETEYIGLSSEKSMHSMMDISILQIQVHSRIIKNIMML